MQDGQTLYEIWTCKGRELGIVPKLTISSFDAGRDIEIVHQKYPEYEVWLRTWRYSESYKEFQVEENIRIY